MDCAEVRKMMDGALDGERIPPAAEAAMLRQHLASCEACRIEDMEMSAIVSAERSRGLESPGGSFAASVMARISESRREPAFWKPAAMLVAAAAAALLAGAIPFEAAWGERAAGAAAAALEQAIATFSEAKAAVSAGVEYAAAIAARYREDSLGLLAAHSAALVALAAALVALSLAGPGAARAGRTV